MDVLKKNYREACERYGIELSNMAKASSLVINDVPYEEIKKNRTPEFMNTLDTLCSLKKEFGKEYLNYLAAKSNELSKKFSGKITDCREILAFLTMIEVKRTHAII